MVVINPLMLASSLGVSIIGLVFIFYRKYIRKRIRAIILRPFTSGYKIVKSQSLKMNVEKFDYKDKSYVVDLSRAILSKTNNPTLHYKLEEAKPLTFKTKDNPVNSGVLKTVLDSNKISKILNPEKDKFMLMLVLGLVVCIVIIAVFGIWRIGTLQTEIAKILAQKDVIII